MKKGSGSQRELLFEATFAKKLDVNQGILTDGDSWDVALIDEANDYTKRQTNQLGEAFTRHQRGQNLRLDHRKSDLRKR